MAAWTRVGAVNTEMGGQGWRGARGSAFGFMFPFTRSPRGALGHWSFPGTADGDRGLSPGERPVSGLSSSRPWTRRLLSYSVTVPLAPQPSPGFACGPPSMLLLPCGPSINHSATPLGRCLFCRCLLRIRRVPKEGALRVWASRGRFISGSLIIGNYPGVACWRAASFLGRCSSHPASCWDGAGGHSLLTSWGLRCSPRRRLESCAEQRPPWLLRGRIVSDPPGVPLASPPWSPTCSRSSGLCSLIVSLSLQV